MLRYLVEATIRDGAPPTQYEIAVDALGKDSDFDLANDSYPRVQISRLRTNLDNYYARNKPKHNARIMLEQGQYRLSLEQVADHADPNPAADTVTPHLAASAVAAPSSIDLLGKPDIALFPEESPVKSRMRWWLVGAISGVILVVLVTLAIFVWYYDSSESVSAGVQTPSIELRAENWVADGDTVFADQIEMTVRNTQIHLTNSFVSRLTVQDSEGNPDYILDMKFMVSRGGTKIAFIRLLNKSGMSLFSDRIDFDPENPRAFEIGIDSALVSATSPTGAIARHELRRIGDEPQTSYACFIKIENGRADAQRTSELVEQCIEDFPNSDYSPYLFSRRAFSYFQKRRLAGEPIERSGAGWSDLTHALSQDQFNAFANFVAAKVELANGNCTNAQGHIERAFMDGSSYPAMMAALEAEANACPAFRTDQAEVAIILRAMIEYNSSPDALLHLYMLIAAVSLDDMESAQLLAGRTRLGGAPGVETNAIALINKSLSDPAFAQTNQEAIRSSVALFIWSDAGVDLIVKNLIEA